jgi:PAS domain S-box-containing protein
VTDEGERQLRERAAELAEEVRDRSAELETVNAFLDSVIQHIPYMVLVKRASDLAIVRANHKVEELLGRSEKELLGKTSFDISAADEAEFFTLKDREALAQGVEVDVPEETLHTPHGVRILHAKKIPILDEAGQPRYLLSMAEDVTERKKREREIERLNAALAQRSTEVEAANRAKGTFLATMSHEIRTPLNGMLGMLELLGLSHLDPEQRETLAVVRESSRSLLRIIDDILDFSKIEAGKLEIRPEAVSIKRVIEDVQSIYSGNASSKGLVVRRTVDPRISPALWVDPVRLRQILNNFVSNAIKFTVEGSVELSAEWLGRAEGRDNLQFVVRDSGIGISKEDQQRLFQPFSQALGDRRSSGGSGLGLVISRQLAQMMGGTITMESEPGQGTTISLVLSLPIVEAPQADAAAAPAAAPAQGERRHAPAVAQAEAEGTLLLLVDDHPVNRMLLLRQVHTLGYAAEAAEDGVQALELWKSGRFGLVVTDCHMPHMDGYELARSIRRHEAERGRPRMPIIACTANALAGEADKCFAAGMDDVLVKPVELGPLSAKLDRWLPLPQVPTALAAPAGGAGPGTAPAAGPIDPARLAKNCGEDAQMLAEVLAAFRRTCEEDSAALQQAVAARDAEEARRCAHRIGGASSMVGALGLAAACASVEQACRAADWEALPGAMQAFERERGKVMAWLREQP